MSILVAGAQAAPTNWATFWAYAGVAIAVTAAVGGVTIGYVRLRLNQSEQLLDAKLKAQADVLTERVQGIADRLGDRVDDQGRRMDEFRGDLRNGLRGLSEQIAQQIEQVRRDLRRERG